MPEENSLDGFIRHLQDVGFYISNGQFDEHSIHKLKHYVPAIGQARFSEYALPFQTAMSNNSIEPVGINEVLKLYKFDRRLRLLCLDAIERIEVATKSQVLIQYQSLHGTKWYQNSALLNSMYPEFYEHVMSDIYRTPGMKDQSTGKKRSIDQFDSNTVMSAISYAKAETLLTKLPRKNRKNVARHFNLPEQFLVNWFRSFRLVRNRAAHHSRLWNRTYRYSPLLMRQWDQHIGENIPPEFETRFYAYALCLYAFLGNVARNTRWQCRLLALMHSDLPKSIDVKVSMGFPENWHRSPFWNVNECYEYFSKAQF